MSNQNPIFKKSLYIFTRDLRIQDNHCLYKASRESEVVYPIFILTNDQIKKNKYKNIRAIDFMCATLLELAQTIPICIFEGNPKIILKYLIKMAGIDAIFINKDVTPFAKTRESMLKELCDNVFVGYDNFLGRIDEYKLDNPNHNTESAGNFGGCLDLRKSNKYPYMVFTPFYNNAISLLKLSKKKYNLENMRKISSSQNTSLLKKYIINWKSPFIPGRNAAETALKDYIRRNPSYKKIRDLPALHATTHLSAYLHYGVLGPVECAISFLKCNDGKELIKQLLWREFYLYIIDYSHTDYTKLSRSIPSRNKIKWKNNPIALKRWQTGTTGIPWIDAAMVQLNKTGYMENRMRMNVAMFLTFYLQIDWKEGEQYFAQNLVDYDYCNNLGGWLWSSSWEVHSNEYYRCFSMESQMKRFDKNGDYVKKWLPIYKDIPAKELYNWPKYYEKYKIGPDPHINRNISRKI